MKQQRLSRTVGLNYWLFSSALLILGFHMQTFASASPVIATANGSTPGVIAFILTDADFASALTEAEQQERLSQGQPIPAFATELLANDGSMLKEKQANRPSPASAPATEGWQPLYTESFEAAWPAALDPHCTVRSTDPRYQWGSDDTRALDGTYAAWPAAGGAAGLDPAVATYPENLITQLICTFSEIGSFDNIMTEFAIWQDAADPDDRFFVGFYTGGLTETGSRQFHGFEWTQAHFDQSQGEHVWEARRLYYPEAATNMVRQASNEIAVMWQFRSDALQQPARKGVWLDNLRIERYVEPVASHNCQALDPAVMITGRAGSGIVSKGVNLPPYLEDNLPERLDRLVAMGVNWVRLELAVQPDALIDGYTDGDLALRTLDLKYYDALIDGLCARGIATLGLLDYQTLLRNDWQQRATLSAGYRTAFLNITALLGHQFRNRIRYWEIWNEPDYSASRLQPGAYVDLLVAAYATIKAVDASDQVIFGGLGSADTNAHNYLRAFYSELALRYPDQPSPFDIFALHPYYSTLYRDNANRLLIDPNSYLRFEAPTIISKFVATLAGANAAGHDDSDKEIWVTEIGWNSAKGAAIPAGCGWLQEQLVTRAQQAAFLTASFDTLFKEAVQENDRPVITKIFWYQYRDTAVVTNCAQYRGTETPARLTTASQPAQAAANPAQLVHWWFGLFDGAFAPKDAALAFQAYGVPVATPTPTVTPTPLPTATPTIVPTAPPPLIPTDWVYLPLIQR